MLMIYLDSKERPYCAAAGRCPMIPLVTIAFLLAPTLPTIDVDNPGSAVFYSADYSQCWIERGSCAESRPNSRARMNQQCG